MQLLGESHTRWVVDSDFNWDFPRLPRTDRHHHSCLGWFYRSSCLPGLRVVGGHLNLWTVDSHFKRYFPRMWLSHTHGYTCLGDGHWTPLFGKGHSAWAVDSHWKRRLQKLQKFAWDCHPLERANHWARNMAAFKKSFTGFKLAPEQLSACRWFAEAMDVALREKKNQTSLRNRAQHACLLTGAGGTRCVSLRRIYMHASLGYDAAEAFDERVWGFITLFEDDDTGPIHTPFFEWTNQNIWFGTLSLISEVHHRWFCSQ